MATTKKDSDKYAALPIPVRRAIVKLGNDMNEARRRRRIPAALLAERCSISRTTLRKVERGDPGVSMGIYATVLFALGLHGRLAEIANPQDDQVGLDLEAERLPRRVRLPRRGGASQ